MYIKYILGREEVQVTREEQSVIKENNTEPEELLNNNTDNSDTVMTRIS